GRRVRRRNCQTSLEVPSTGSSIDDNMAKSEPTNGGQQSEPNPFADLRLGEGTTSPVFSTARKSSKSFSNETWIGIGATAIAVVVLVLVVWVSLTQGAREAASITVDDFLLAAKTWDDFRFAADERALRKEAD